MTVLGLTQGGAGLIHPSSFRLHPSEVSRS
jgi:hypothetical protein